MNSLDAGRKEEYGMNIFDFIVIGGGTAGAIVARRIAEANMGTVALLEAGKSDEHDPLSLDLSKLELQQAEADWGFSAKPVKEISRRLNYSRAKVLGGCGSHNDCAFIFPPEEDHLRWESLGAKGWGPAGMRAAIEKVRDAVPVNVAERPHNITLAFMKAVRSLGFNGVDYRKVVEEGKPQTTPGLTR
jgi:choline dehydrogenase-like flavoprotein